MTDAALAACPACAAAPEPPAALAAPRPPAALRRVELSLPHIHCAACITGVERTLDAEPGVAAARVNLTLRRASVTAEDAPGLEARLIAALDARGFEARPLDSAALEATRIDAEGRDLLARIAVAGFASMNVMLLSVSVWSGAEGSTRDLMHWISAAIALPAVAFAAQPFFAQRPPRPPRPPPRHRRADLDRHPPGARRQPARDHRLRPPRLLRGGADADLLPARRPLPRPPHPRRRPLRRRRDRRARGRIPPSASPPTAAAPPCRSTPCAKATSSPSPPARASRSTAPSPPGRSEIDPSLLTGETMPEPVAPGATVRAGMLNLSGPLELRADALGEDTLLARDRPPRRDRRAQPRPLRQPRRPRLPRLQPDRLRPRPRRAARLGPRHPRLAPRHQHRRRRAHRHLPLRASASPCRPS